MQIASVHLTVSDLDTAASFFGEVLELPTQTNVSAVEVTVGRTRLRLSEGLASAGVYHVAFDIPPSTFHDHRDWLARKLPLLHSADGVSEFEGPDGWNSRSIYFEGPDRMVLELIARRERPQEAGEVPHLTSISEVGVAVNDVEAATKALANTLGLEVFGGFSDQFAPVGDHDGLIIVVRAGRGWLPVFDVAAESMPTQVKVSVGSNPTAGSARTVRLNELAMVTT